MARLTERITEYLEESGMSNPELVKQDALLIECRDALAETDALVAGAYRAAAKANCTGCKDGLPSFRCKGTYISNYGEVEEGTWMHQNANTSSGVSACTSHAIVSLAPADAQAAVDSLVAGAYLAARQVIKAVLDLHFKNNPNHLITDFCEDFGCSSLAEISDDILALTPADAKAALAALIAEKDATSTRPFLTRSQDAESLLRSRWRGDLDAIPFGKVIEFMQSFAEQVSTTRDAEHNRIISRWKEEEEIWKETEAEQLDTISRLEAELAEYKRFAEIIGGKSPKGKCNCPGVLAGDSFRIAHYDDCPNRDKPAIDAASGGQ